MAEAAALHISDHALLRWIERRYGVDLESERVKLRKAVERHVGRGNYIIRAEHLQFVMKDTTIVTVLTSDMRGRRVRERG